MFVYHVYICVNHVIFVNHFGTFMNQRDMLVDHLVMIAVKIHTCGSC